MKSFRKFLTEAKKCYSSTMMEMDDSPYEDIQREAKDSNIVDTNKDATNFERDDAEYVDDKHVKAEEAGDCEDDKDDSDDEKEVEKTERAIKIKT